MRRSFSVKNKSFQAMQRRRRGRLSHKNKGNSSSKERSSHSNLSSLLTPGTPSQTHQSNLTVSELPKQFCEVLESKTLRERFREFLDERVATECLNFYEAVELYEQILKPELRQKAGKHLVEDYLAIDAKYAINIPYEIRESILTCEFYVEDTFLAAKHSVVELMSSNFFHKFKKKLLNSNAKLNKPTLSFESKENFRSQSFEELSFLSMKKISFKGSEGEDEEKKNDELAKRGRIGFSSVRARSSSINLFINGRFSMKKKVKKVSSLNLNKLKNKKEKEKVKTENKSKRRSHLDNEVWREINKSQSLNFDF